MYSTIIFLDLAEYHRLKDCEKQMHQLILEKKNSSVAASVASSAKKIGPQEEAAKERPAASLLEGEGAGEEHFSSPRPSDTNVDVSPPPQIPIMISSLTNKIDPSLLRQTVAAEKKASSGPSNPGHQINPENVLPSSSKAGGFEMQDSTKKTAPEAPNSSDPWYYLGGYDDYSDSE